MNIRFLFILSLCTWSSFFYSQEQESDKASFREKFEAANSLMEDNLFEFAKEIWLELVKEQPENSNVNYKTGYCLLKSANNKKEAFEYLNFAKSNIIERYSPLDHSVKGSPVEVLYYLGKSFHLNYEPDSALKYFNKFIELSSKKHFLKEMVFHDIKQCEIATKQLLKPKNYRLENIGGEINSSYSDFSPVITADESAIFFTSRRLRTDTNQVSNEGIYSPQDS